MITPIQNLFFTPKVQLKNVRTQNSLQLRPALSADVVAFGNSKPDLLTLPPRNIFERMVNSINRYNIIGMGGEAMVFSIDDSGYCVRCDNNVNEFDLSDFADEYSDDITEEEKVNHVVAKFGDYLTIMPIIKGSPVWSVGMDEDEIIRQSQNIANLPLSAFKDLFLQINDAYQKDMMFDCNWSNVLVDTENQKLIAIDFSKNTDEDWEMAQHLPYMYAALTTDFTAEKEKKIIAQKVMNAGLSQLEPGVGLCCDFGDFGFSRLIKDFEDLKLFTSPKYISLLRTLISKIEDLKYQEVRGVDVSKALKEQINTVKAIMYQLANF